MVGVCYLMRKTPPVVNAFFLLQAQKIGRCPAGLSRVAAQMAHRCYPLASRREVSMATLISTSRLKEKTSVPFFFWGARRVSARFLDTPWAHRCVHARKESACRGRPLFFGYKKILDAIGKERSSERDLLYARWSF